MPRAERMKRHQQEVLTGLRDAQLKIQPRLTAEDYRRANELASQHKRNELEKLLTERLVKPWLKHFRCLRSGPGRPEQNLLLQQEAARMYSGEPEIGIPSFSYKEIKQALGFPSTEAVRKAVESYRRRNRRIQANLTSNSE